MRSACRAQGGHSFRLVPQMPCRVGTGPTADARARGRVVANPPMPTRPVRSRPRPPAHLRCEGGLCRQPVTGPAEPVQGDPWRFTGLGSITAAGIRLVSRLRECPTVARISVLWVERPPVRDRSDGRRLPDPVARLELAVLPSVFSTSGRSALLGHRRGVVRHGRGVWDGRCRASPDPLSKACHR